MKLKCSLLGHAFDETDVEREREERGSEVVTIVRDVERCSRCGTERVVSENKEVVSVLDSDDIELDAQPTDGGSSAENGGGGIGGMVERSGALDDDDVTHPAVRQTEAEDADEEAPDPAEEDAEILTDDGPVERSPGQWPDDTDDEEWRPESLTRRPESPDSVDADDDTGSSAPVEPAPDPDPTPVGNTDTAGSNFTVPDGELACPACGHTVDAASSFRAGDSCPDCRQGYLEQR